MFVALLHLIGSRPVKHQHLLPGLKLRNAIKNNIPFSCHTHAAPQSLANVGGVSPNNEVNCPNGCKQVVSSQSQSACCNQHLSTFGIDWLLIYEMVWFVIVV